MNKLFLISFCIGLLACGGKSDNKPFPFNSNHTIALSEFPDSLELKAATILKQFLEEIEPGNWELDHTGQTTNSTFQLQIDEKNLANYTIEYTRNANTITIKGGSSRSLLYAVYEFLEYEMGLQFCSPKVINIPNVKDIDISVDLKRSYTPDIQTRTVHSRLFYENRDFADARKVTYEAFPTYAPGARVHTFNKFLPAEIFYDAHPEYYALRNGKRRSTQLCLTNETVLQIVKDSVASLIGQFPQAKVISVSQDDNSLHCLCEACKAIDLNEESASGTMIHFVNQIAEDFPNIQISTLAYQYTRKAPKYVKPLHNVLITLCSIECDRSAPIDQKCPDFTQDLMAWGKITDNIRIWDYTTQFTNFLAPFPNLNTLQPNIQLFEKNNAKWIFEQHSNQPSELFELRSYLTAKLLWDPNLDFKKTMADFLNGYYQDGAPYIQSYIDRIHAEIKNDSSFFLFLYGDPSQGFRSFLKREFLEEYDGYFGQSILAVQHKPEVVSRVNEARLSTDYAILEYAKSYLKEAINDTFIDLSNRLKRFESTCNLANITAMNEMRYTVQDYLELYKNTLSRLGPKNLAEGKKVVLSTKPKKYAQEDPLALTNGAFGGASFYSNWLGFEGNDMIATIDLEEVQKISEVRTAFLQVTNHIVFFPTKVEIFGSIDGNSFDKLGLSTNRTPLSKESKINDIQYFNIEFPGEHEMRFLRVKATSMKTAPEWHNASGLPAWVFCDEVIVL